MSAKTRAKIRDRMSQAQLDALINKPIPIEREHVAPKPMLFNHLEYDTLHPEEVIRSFCAAVRNMISTYNTDKERLSKLESEMQDLLHYIEMGKDKNAREGFKLYQKLCEIRRERRICKNEIDLLQPVYNAFSSKLLDTLSNIQGECRTAKQIIDGKGYTVRTDILDELV